MTAAKRFWFLGAFAALVAVVGGFGLVDTLTWFARTMVRGDVPGFGVVAVAVYFTGMLPLLFLTLWGAARGHLRDIERPRFRMLELDQEIERRGNVIPRR